MRKLILIGFIFLNLFPPPLWGAIAFLQSCVNINASGAAVSTLGCSSTVNIGAGDLLMTWCRQDTNLVLPTSVTDSVNTYIHDTTADVNTMSSGDYLSLWYVLSAATCTGCTPTCNFNGTHTFVSSIFREYTGCTSCSLDVSTSAVNTGNVSSLTSGSFSTTGTNEVIGCGGSTSNTNNTFSVGNIGGTAATNLVGDAAGGSQMTASEDKIFSATQSGITAAISWSSAGKGELSCGAFKAAAVTGGFNKNQKLLRLDE